MLSSVGAALYSKMGSGDIGWRLHPRVGGPEKYPTQQAQSRVYVGSATHTSLVGQKLFLYE